MRRSSRPDGVRDTQTVRPAVLHVAESFASGVAGAIGDYARSTPHLEHHLLFALRGDAPADPRLFEAFASSTAMHRGHARRILQAARLIRSLRPRVVHGHSSFGGVYARLAGAVSEARVVYTPHCFAFERTDLPRPARLAVLGIEWILSRVTDAVAACSEREATLARRLSSRLEVAYVPNILPAWPASEDPATRVSATPRVGGAGRMGAQKDPLFFAEIASAVRAERPQVEFVWIGGGSEDQVAEVASHGVRVTGWIPRRQVLDELAACDLYIHTARWEGYPLGLLEAVAARVPSLLRRVPSTGSFPSPTLFTSVEEGGRRAVALLEDASLRESLSDCWTTHVQPNTAEEQRNRLSAVYRTTVSAHQEGTA